MSTNNEYRYVLWRLWDPRQANGICAWVMLNPSTADETEPDKTITKCVGFARKWGHAGIVVVNLFALRSRDPSVLTHARDAVGTHNAHFVNKVLHDSRITRRVVAWGNEGALDARDEAFFVTHTELELHCLQPPGKEALTRLGAPRHPVRLGYDSQLRSVCWKGAIELTGDS